MKIRSMADPRTIEQQLRESLPEADPPVLLMSYVQLTGDDEFMERFRPYIRKVREFADNIPLCLIGELHERIIRILCADNQPEPKAISRDLLTRMMSVCVGEPVPEAYMPMVLSELDVDRSDVAAEYRSARPSPGFPSDFRVAVIGGGLSGICAAAHLHRAGISFELFEKNEAIGGTWWENQYPGCGVDTMNHWYSYSFAMKHDWTRYFVQRQELHDYLLDCVRNFDLEGHIRLQTMVTSARWDETRSEWVMAYAVPSGKVEELRFNAIFCGVGQLNNPSIPAIRGVESFQGQAFHSSRWPRGLDITGKRVALIGTGATGTQIAPAIVDKVAALDIYQRSAHWVTGRANYTKAVEAGKKWALSNVPFYARWYRFQILWAYGDGLYRALQREEGWENPRRSISPANEEIRKVWNGYLEQALADRPDLLNKSRPNYPPYGKRPLFDNNWFATLKKPHVSLVQTPIDHVDPGAIVTSDGAQRETDIIVFATGFQASKMVYSVEVTGLENTRLRDVWGDDNPKAYLGSTVPGFPNFFLLYGPNTNLAHGGSIAFIAERQAEYGVRCLTEMKRRGVPAMSVTEQANQRYNEEVDALHGRLVWSVDGLDTWYKNKTGRVTTNSPWSLLKYWTLTRNVEPRDYDFLRATDEVAELAG
jgi:4-hydroxyacetophenone monooxygenase